MTRFIMSLEEAVDLVLFAFENGQNGDILVQKAPACTIQTQAEDITKRSCKPRAEISVLNLCRTDERESAMSSSLEQCRARRRKTKSVQQRVEQSSTS